MYLTTNSNISLIPSVVTLPYKMDPNNINDYISYAKSFPNLTEEEELKLCLEFYKNGVVQAGQMIFLSHLKLVIKIAMAYKKFRVSMFDLISEGNYGLIRAMKKFSMEKSVRFSTYATLWIKSQINDFILKTKSIVKLGTTAIQKKIMYNYEKSKAQLDLVDSNKNYDLNAQIAQSLDIEEDEMMQVVKASNSISLDADTDYNSDKNAVFEDKNSSLLNSNISTDFIGQRTLFEALHLLDERERDIIQSMVISNDKITLSDMAKKYNVSMERVRQIKEKALESLKKNLISKNFVY